MNNTSTTLSAIFKFSAAFLLVVNVFFIFAGMILNSVVIMSLWNSQLRRKLCCFMIFVQACFDLAVVVVIHPLIIRKIITGWISMNFAELHWTRYFYILIDFSFTGLLAMTLERYLALSYPFFHQKFVTKPRLMTSFMLSGLLSSVFFLLYKKDPKHFKYEVIYYVIFGGLFLTACILNFKLFYIARTIRKRSVVTLGSLDGSDSEARNVDTKKFKLTLASLGKISTCLLVLVCLFVCHVPWFISYAVEMTRKLNGRDQDKFIIVLWRETFFTINSSLNCLIFFYKNSVLRRNGRVLLKKYFGSLRRH